MPAGEEMTRYCMELILKEWVNPFIDTNKWEYFDCSCKNRDATDDQVRLCEGGSSIEYIH